jgi:hypothetical protein
MRSQARVALTLVGVICLSISSCSKRDSGPPVAPGPPGSPTVVRVEISGPSEIEPGQSVQFTATAFKSDNTTENVTPLVVWSPTNSPVLTVTPGGLVTGKARGEQVIQARHQTRTATLRVFVLPRGTFKLSGNVRESGVGIQDAEVSVVSGTGQGLTTKSGFNGAYALYGVAGNVRVQLTRDGYQTRQADLDVRSHQVEQLEITALQARQDYRGVYRLTIAAAGCRSGNASFPEEARRRVYTATVSQDGGRLTVKLSDANLLLARGRGDQFTGFVDVGGGIKFSISDSIYYYYYYYAGAYDIIERMTDQTVLMVATVTAQGTPARITGAMNGAIITTPSATSPLTPFAHMCYSPTHGFEMERR